MTPAFIGAEVEGLLDWVDLADAIAAGHALPRAELGDTFLHRGEDVVLTRSAIVDGLGAAVKTATLFPGNGERGLPTINGGVALYSDADGRLEAMLDFHLVTKWKTAADSLLGALRLAPPEVGRILIVGAGSVARSLREAYGEGFPAARFTVWNRSRERAEALAHGFADTEVASELGAAVAEADIVTVATMSRTPVIRGEWLRPGQHLDLIGAYRSETREADDRAISRGRLFVDSRETAGGIGEIADPLARGVIGPDAIRADFYELDAFSRAPEDITVFKNAGGAHLDLMTARYMLEVWRDR